MRRTIWRRRAAVGLLSLLLTAAWLQPAAATETDQWLAWLVELPDATAPLNAYVNEELARMLEEIGGKTPPCTKLPKRFFRRLFPSMLQPRIRRIVFRERNAVVRFPGTEVGYFGYLRASVYRRLAFPFLVPMSRTIEMNGIRMGSDKLGHMLGHGRHYYDRYLKARSRGLPVEEALLKAVRWGVRVESLFVGGLVDGVFSHADLEANFQGMQLARRFCEGPEPYLERTSEGWRQVRPVDLRDFVNPGFDESYNNSYYARFRWKRVRPILVKDHCPHYSTAAVQDRLAYYRRIDEPSLSRRFIQAEYQSRGKFLQAEQNVEALCGSLE